VGLTQVGGRKETIERGGDFKTGSGSWAEETGVQAGGHRASVLHPWRGDRREGPKGGGLRAFVIGKNVITQGGRPEKR